MRRKVIFTENQFNYVLKSSIKESVSEMELFHGTRADFDKFDFAYLSTGWGKQAYGYGFYLTDSYEAAQEYSCGGKVYKVEVPDGMYLLSDTITRREAENIARKLYYYMINEREDSQEAYGDDDAKKSLWDYEVSYVGKSRTGVDVYGTVASILGSDEETSNFLKSIGYTGIKIFDDSPNIGENITTYVIFNADDIKVISKENV